MPIEVEETIILQLSLFDFEKTSSGAFELFPKVWAASEALTDLNPGNRIAGLTSLEQIQAHRFSPLIAFLLFSKIIDPDLNFRIQLIRILANVLETDEHGKLAPEPVRQNLLFHLSQMDNHQTWALLEASNVDSKLDLPIAILLKANCDAGNQLLDFITDKKIPLNLRERALFFIVRVGFVDAIPGIERLINKLESRINGQQIFPFSSVESSDETQLLPDLKIALAALQAP